MTQPAPKKTDTPEVWPLVVADVRSGVYSFVAAYWEQRLAAEMDARNAFGTEKHGVPLQVENGRDSLRDSLEEALDLCAYTRQTYEKAERGEDWEIHCEAVRLASRLLWRIHLRDEETT